MTFRFGDVRIDTDARQVWRGSELVHLPKKAFELLVLLLERRPNAVPKNQIHERLWPETYVSESSIQALISDIRQAIGDDGRRRAVLRTVHGVGYAFSADVAEDVPVLTTPRGPVRAWLMTELGRVPLYAGENTLGRTGPDVTEVDDSTVSRRHATINIANDQAILEDLGSKNGTWLNSERVTAPAVLLEGAVVLLGSVRCTFRIARSAASTDTLPSALRPTDGSAPTER